ncbi:hypothetical protein [Desulfonema magnum]|uniref:Uncharacterized protein n=1 Tax=Desulfonema magnum TaxID=45655 RepID=A0A975BIC3_9BACT|nr:hypothetical protein [Desulfonema magnum]QTA86224.1 Uncharacterized protein dnm_022450 [Desulfonema magnum]
MLGCLGDFWKRTDRLFQFVVPPLGGATPPKGGTTNYGTANWSVYSWKSPYFR